MNESRYPYVHLGCAERDAELAADLLWGLGALGVEERDATTLVKGDAGRPVTLVAAFADEAGARHAIAALPRRFAPRLQHVVGDAWRDGWKAHFRPTRIGRRIVVVPSWERYRPRRGDVVLSMDPGAAFGTGTHETTRLTLCQLDKRVKRGQPVLDVGCGSAILSLAALKLGASRARAIDVDPTAVEVARENARRNRLASRLRADTVPVERVRGRYPLVLANIETHVLVPLAPALMARVADGGTLVLSGILTPERAQVERAYGAFERLERRREGEWTCLALRRPRRRVRSVKDAG